MELACSDYMNIKNVQVYTNNEDTISTYKDYLPKKIPSDYKHMITNIDNVELNNEHNVILIDEKFIDEEKSQALIKISLNALTDDGYIILINKQYENDYKSCQHSHTVGTKLKTGYDIPHYSDLIFKELQDENQNRESAIQVIYKKDNA